MAAAFKGPEISIHALLAESDYTLYCPPFGEIKLFLSTLSLRRATEVAKRTTDIRPISIHALLAESDYLATRKPNYICRISIHALLAESDKRAYNIIKEKDISIHALLAESDLMWYQCNTVVKISIHALLAESDT